MNDIITQNPVEVLENSNSLFFMVVWSSSQGTFFGTGGGGIQKVETGKMDSPAFDRSRAVEEYYNVVRVAKVCQRRGRKLTGIKAPFMRCSKKQN